MNIVVNLMLIAISVLVIIWLARRAIRNARRLDERIEEYHKEQEEQGPVDIYSALSELFTKDPEDKRPPDK